MESYITMSLISMPALKPGIPWIVCRLNIVISDEDQHPTTWNTFGRAAWWEGDLLGEGFEENKNLCPSGCLFSLFASHVLCDEWENSHSPAVQRVWPKTGGYAQKKESFQGDASILFVMES